MKNTDVVIKILRRRLAIRSPSSMTTVSPWHGHICRVKRLGRKYEIHTITLTGVLSNTYADIMTVADKVTLSRIIVAPFFFFVLKAQFIPRQPALVALWIMFCWMELSDLIDGRVARTNNQVTSFGKLFDPFADVISRVTYFLAFASIGIMPLWVLLVVLYREFGILFLRMLLGLKGIAMGARSGGKLKAGVYMVAGLLSLVLYTVRFYSGADVSGPVSLSGAGGLTHVLGLLTLIAYILAAVATVLSFIDYLVQFRKLYR